MQFVLWLWHYQGAMGLKKKADIKYIASSCYFDSEMEVIQNGLHGDSEILNGVVSQILSYQIEVKQVHWEKGSCLPAEDTYEWPTEMNLTYTWDFQNVIRLQALGQWTVASFLVIHVRVPFGFAFQDFIGKSVDDRNFNKGVKFATSLCSHMELIVLILRSILLNSMWFISEHHN